MRRRDGHRARVLHDPEAGAQGPDFGPAAGAARRGRPARRTLRGGLPEMTARRSRSFLAWALAAVLSVSALLGLVARDHTARRAFAQSTVDPLIAMVEGGSVGGVAAGSVISWKGIPYAA